MIPRRRSACARRFRTATLRAAAALAFAALLTRTAPAEAAPQMSAGVTTGAALTDFRAANGPRLAYHLGGRFDVLFLRDAPGDMAVGPYVDVATAAFDTFEVGGGLSWLVPVGATAFVLSGGGFGRAAGFGFEPGASGTLFWGSRSYNYHSSYGIAAGLFAQGRYGFGEGKQADGIVGVQIDLEYLALPFLLAYQAITR